MNKKFCLLIIIILCFAFNLPISISTVPQESKELKPNNITISSTKNYKYKSIDFNLGLDYIDDNKGYEDPYYIRGTMSVPINIENKKLNPVIIVHGCHDNRNKKRYDTGFKYLTDFLAQNGYLAVSVDVNAAYDWNYGQDEEFIKIPEIVDSHIEALKKANKGENYYGIDLKNKINFDNISLVGHSRGGEAVFRIVEQQRKKGIKIDNLLVIAPTNNIDTNYNVGAKNISILVPALDGDVIDLVGLSIYNTIRIGDKNTKILSATTLKNGNHNYFNSEVKYNDSQMLKVDLTNQISRYEQEAFLQEFAVDFLDVCFGKDKKNTIYDDSISTITKINGLDVLTYLSTENRKEIVDISEVNSFRTNNANMDIVEDFYAINKDSSPGINLPGHNESPKDLLSITWNKNDSYISFKPNVSDFSKYSGLSINVLVDGLNKLNKKGIPQSIGIELVDKRGKSQMVEIHRNTYLLSYPQGKRRVLDFNNNSRVVSWDEVTPMNNIRIPFKYYDSINLSKIKVCNIYFNNLESGALMFESFSIN